MGARTIRRISGLDQPRLVDELVQRAAHAVEPLALGELAQVRARDEDDIVPAGQLRAARGERLAQQSLDAVAVHRAADLARDRQPQARLLLAPAGERVEHEE